MNTYKNLTKIAVKLQQTKFKMQLILDMFVQYYNFCFIIRIKNTDNF